MTKLHILALALFALSFEIACAEDSGDYECTVSWTDNGMEVGMAELSYSSLDSADEAVMMCEEEQADHEERPDTADGYSCDCASK